MSNDIPEYPVVIMVHDNERMFYEREFGHEGLYVFNSEDELVKQFDGSKADDTFFDDFIASPEGFWGNEEEYLELNTDIIAIKKKCCDLFADNISIKEVLDVLHYSEFRCSRFGVFYGTGITSFVKYLEEY